MTSVADTAVLGPLIESSTVSLEGTRAALGCLSANSCHLV